MSQFLKSSSIIYVFIAIALVMAGGCSSNVWDEIPDNITSFLSEYFPGQGVAGYSDTPDDGCRIEMRNGATITFDVNGNWATIDGNGNTLPEVLVYDQLPPALFQHLEEMEQTTDVYKLSRTSSTYIVTLRDTYITYDVDSATITYPAAKQVRAKTSEKP